MPSPFEAQGRWVQRKKHDGKRRSGRDRRLPKLGPRVSRTPLTQVGAPASLGPGSPANGRDIHSLSLHPATRLLRSCVPGVLSPQACVLSTGLLCLGGHPTVPHLVFSLRAPKPRGTSPMSFLPNHWTILPLSLCGASPSTEHSAWGHCALERALALILMPPPPCPESPNTQPPLLGVHTVP